MNNVILGDCLDELKKINDNSIDLIYLDPPFYTQRKQKLKKVIDDENTREYLFDDNWNSIYDYLDFMKVRLIECRRVLKNSGSIFLHCDRNACHYLKVVMDEVFGSDEFRSEIIWSYKRWSNTKKGLLNAHQNIYFYSKSKNFKFNVIYGDYSVTTNVDQLLQNRKKDDNGTTKYDMDSEGNIVLNYNKKGVPLTDVWEIPYLNPKAKERNGYPTQKPILLLERIISIATDKGDVVLDPFCGSGTTLAAAKLLERNYIGIDISKDACDLAKKRLSDEIVKTNSRLLVKGIDSYIEKTEEEILILKGLNAVVIHRNSGIDGIIPNNNASKVVAIKIQKDNETIEECVIKITNACKSKKIVNKVIIRKDIDNCSYSYDDIIILDRYSNILENKLKTDK